MEKIRIHCVYKHVDRPWGGANNFLRALYEQLLACGAFSFTENIEDPCDILFMNQLGKGPGGGGGAVPLELVRRLTVGRRGFFEKLHRTPSSSRRKLVVRAVNLNAHAFSKGPRYWLWGRRYDLNSIKLMHLADLVIFQSGYQRDFFMAAGYRGQRNVVIHNGADTVFAQGIRQAPLAAGEPLRFVASSVSTRSSKQHALISRLSTQPGVEVSYFGTWPEGIDPANIRCMGVVPREQLAEEAYLSHYFFHPAIKDPCPNVVFEAICSGLPVVYFDGPGSSREIVADCGFPIIADDLPGMVAMARERLEELQAVVRNVAPRYAIGRAALAYREAFESVLTQPQETGEDDQ